MTIPATCTSEGESKVFCAVCNDELSVQIIPRAEHVKPETPSIIDPTCTQPGALEYLCAVCGESLSTVPTFPARGHVEDGRKIVPPTCVEPGKVITFCSICGEHIPEKEETTLDPTGHKNLTYSTIPPTCLDPGKAITVCADCGTIVESEEYAPAAGHDPGDWTIKAEATCQAEGVRERTCKVCGETVETEAIPVAACKPTISVVYREATCTVNGVASAVCEWCAKPLGFVEIPAAHAFDGEVVAPTCVEKGSTIQTCRVCGHVEKIDETEALGHTYTSETVPQEGMEPGYTKHTCTVCGETYTDNIITPPTAAGIVKEDVLLHISPDPASETVTDQPLPTGTKITVIGDLSGSYIFVEAPDGLKGYVNAAFIELTP